MTADDVWNLFTETGDILCYLLFCRLRHEEQETTKTA